MPGSGDMVAGTAKISEVPVSDLCAAATLEPRPGKPEGSMCREWDGQQPGWAAAGPLCETEIRTAERDVRVLLYDYIDLEQALPPALSQALDTQSQYAQRAGHPIPMREAVEALQRDIWWTVTAWAEVLGDRQRLADPSRQVRDGYAVQWAITRLQPRIHDLALVGAVTMADYPLAGDDVACRFRSVAHVEVAGWEAVLHLSALRSRARSMLGRTHRTMQLPGPCSGRDPRTGRACGGVLYRDEPRFETDPCPVYCGTCDERRTYDQYEQYVGLLLTLPADELAEAAA